MIKQDLLLKEKQELHAEISTNPAPFLVVPLRWISRCEYSLKGDMLKLAASPVTLVCQILPPWRPRGQKVSPERINTWPEQPETDSHHTAAAAA